MGFGYPIVLTLTFFNLTLNFFIKKESTVFSILPLKD